MSDLAATLNKEVGAGPLKLPLWGWAIAGVGGVIVARKIAGHLSASTAAATDTTTADPTISGGGGYFGANGALGVPNGALDTATSSTITDNDAWRIAAINALVTGGYDALLATSAVEKYLTGQQLTTQETGAIDYALTRIGPPPTAVPAPLPIVPPIKTPPVTKPPTKVVQQTSPANPKPALAANHLPGEAFVDFCNAPGGGTWWLTNWGGVDAVGGAPYKGAPISNRVANALGAAPSGQTFVSIEPDGAGYLIRDNWPTTGNYAYP